MHKKRIFHLDSIPVAHVENMRGGTGPMESRMSFSPASPIEESLFAATGINTLLPGSSVGWHEHIHDEEIYVIFSGTGHYVDNEGTRHPVKPGDVALCCRGEKHGLENTGTEPLSFIAVIAPKKS